MAKMCGIPKKEREKKLDGEKPKYICKCGKEAAKAKHLCKPERK